MHRDFYQAIKTLNAAAAQSLADLEVKVIELLRLLLLRRRLVGAVIFFMDFHFAGNLRQRR